MTQKQRLLGKRVLPLSTPLRDVEAAAAALMGGGPVLVFQARLSLSLSLSVSLCVCGGHSVILTVSFSPLCVR
jgi:hypothetical protein